MELILKYFPNLSEQQKTQFAALYDLYTDWNSKINVISRKDITNLYEHHVLHSLGIAKVINFTPDTQIMDLVTPIMHLIARLSSFFAKKLRRSEIIFATY